MRCGGCGTTDGIIGVFRARILAVTRAVDEALTNIIRHTYCGRADQPIDVIFRSVREDDPESAEGLEIVLCDRGPAIDPERMCLRALEEIRPGGLGLHFIRQSMDIVEYNRANRTNRLHFGQVRPHAAAGWECVRA